MGNSDDLWIDETAGTKQMKRKEYIFTVKIRMHDEEVEIGTAAFGNDDEETYGIWCSEPHEEAARSLKATLKEASERWVGDAGGFQHLDEKISDATPIECSDTPIVRTQENVQVGDIRDIYRVEYLGDPRMPFSAFVTYPVGDGKRHSVTASVGRLLDMPLKNPTDENGNPLDVGKKEQEQNDV